MRRIEAPPGPLATRALACTAPRLQTPVELQLRLASRVFLPLTVILIEAIFIFHHCQGHPTACHAQSERAASEAPQPSAQLSCASARSESQHRLDDLIPCSSERSRRTRGCAGFVDGRLKSIQHNERPPTGSSTPDPLERAPLLRNLRFSIPERHLCLHGRWPHPRRTGRRLSSANPRRAARRRTAREPDIAVAAHRAQISQRAAR